MIDSSCDAKPIMRFSSLIRDKLKEDDDFIQGMSHFFCVFSFFPLFLCYRVSIIKNDINIDFVFLFVFLGCSTKLNVIDQKDAVELLQGQHKNLDLISIKTVLAIINQEIHVLEVRSGSVDSALQFLFTMAQDRRPPVNIVKEMKLYVSEQEDTNQSFVAAACSSKVLDEKLGKVESELVSDIKCETLDIDDFMSIYDFDIDVQELLGETGITLK